MGYNLIYNLKEKGYNYSKPLKISDYAKQNMWFNDLIDYKRQMSYKYRNNIFFSFISDYIVSFSFSKILKKAGFYFDATNSYKNNNNEICCSRNKKGELKDNIYQYVSAYLVHEYTTIDDVVSLEDYTGYKINSLRSDEYFVFAPSYYQLFDWLKNNKNITIGTAVSPCDTSKVLITITQGLTTKLLRTKNNDVEFSEDDFDDEFIDELEDIIVKLLK